MALTMRAGVQATSGPAGIATGARGGTLASGSNVRPDWNDEPSESMGFENLEEIERQSRRTLRRNNGPRARVVPPSSWLLLRSGFAAYDFLTLRRFRRVGVAQNAFF